MDEPLFDLPIRQGASRQPALPVGALEQGFHILQEGVAHRVEIEACFLDVVDR